MHQHQMQLMNSICIWADVLAINATSEMVFLPPPPFLWNVTWRKFYITVSVSGFLWEPLADKRSKTEFKLLFGFARPPTEQYNRWVECVIKTVARGFPWVFFFFFSRWKDEEEEGLLTKVQRTAVEQHLSACLMLNHLIACRVLQIFFRRYSYITRFTQVPNVENLCAN